MTTSESIDVRYLLEKMAIFQVNLMLSLRTYPCPPTISAQYFDALLLMSSACIFVGYMDVLELQPDVSHCLQVSLLALTLPPLH